MFSFNLSYTLRLMSHFHLFLLVIWFYTFLANCCWLHLLHRILSLAPLCLFTEARIQRKENVYQYWVQEYVLLTHVKHWSKDNVIFLVLPLIQPSASFSPMNFKQKKIIRASVKSKWLMTFISLRFSDKLC